MTVLCPGCRRAMRVPPDKANVPNLRARCSACGKVFAVAEASLALAPAAGAPPPPAPAPAAPPPPVPAVSTPPTPHSAVADAHAASAARPAPPRRRPPARDAWRRCASHGDRPSEGVCTACGSGWCPECVRRQGTAAICASCDALCVPTAEREAVEARARQRARPLQAEVPTILGYPFTDKVAFVAFAVFVGLFALAASVAAFGGGFGMLFSQGLLYAYAFTAINRVSAGKMDSFMPEIGDMADLAGPVRIGLAALLVSSGPLLAMSFLFPPASVIESIGGGSVQALVAPTPAPEPEPTLAPEIAALLSDTEGEQAATEEGPEETGESGVAAEEGFVDEPAVPAWAYVAFALALLWKLVYSPIALVAGAISQSFLKTLNPVVGLDAIRKMGPTYWAAMGLYTVLAVGEFLAGAALGLVPFVGAFLRAFVQSYAYLAIGCLLGLAVFKRAPELGLD